MLTDREQDAQGLTPSAVVGADLPADPETAEPVVRYDFGWWIAEPEPVALVRAVRGMLVNPEALHAEVAAEMRAEEDADRKKAEAKAADSGKPAKLKKAKTQKELETAVRARIGRMGYPLLDPSDIESFADKFFYVTHSPRVTHHSATAFPVRVSPDNLPPPKGVVTGIDDLLFAADSHIHSGKKLAELIQRVLDERAAAGLAPTLPATEFLARELADVMPDIRERLDHLVGTVTAKLTEPTSDSSPLHAGHTQIILPLAGQEVILVPLIPLALSRDIYALGAAAIYKGKGKPAPSKRRFQKADFHVSNVQCSGVFLDRARFRSFPPDMRNKTARDALFGQALYRFDRESRDLLIAKVPPALTAIRKLASKGERDSSTFLEGRVRGALIPPLLRHFRGMLKQRAAVAASGLDIPPEALDAPFLTGAQDLSEWQGEMGEKLSAELAAVLQAKAAFTVSDWELVLINKFVKEIAHAIDWH